MDVAKYNFTRQRETLASILMENEDGHNETIAFIPAHERIENIPNFNSDDMARRIAACLNVFDGVPIEAIDALVEHRSAFAVIAKEDSPAGMGNIVNRAFEDMNDENDNSQR